MLMNATRMRAMYNSRDKCIPILRASRPSVQSATVSTVPTAIAFSDAVDSVKPSTLAG